MKAIARLVILMLISNYFPLTAQNITGSQKIIRLGLQSGNQIMGYLLDTNNDSVYVRDFQLGYVKVANKEIKDSVSILINQRAQIELSEQRIFSGTLIKFSSDSIKIRDENLGNLNIPLNAIKDITPLKQGLPGTWSSDPNNTRYFFAPSAFMLKKGEGYYQNAYILSNSVSYGVTDHFTIGGGIILPIIFYVTPKVGFSPGEYIHLSAGVIAGGTYLNQGVVAGIGYGLVTLGTREHHLSLGAGYGAYYAKKDWQETRKPILNISGTTRLNKRFSLVSENWIFQAAFEQQIEKSEIVNGVEQIYFESIPGQREFVAACSAGGRFVWKKLALDLGVVAPINFPDMNFIVPYIDLVVKF
jgi:hypothetical protein